jgi:uncharacterized cofD-like protein
MTGPSVVALGGGYGLSASLRAARRYAGEVTGIVSVADDGGSSGRLRRAFGIPAPGDLRRCLVAVAAEGNVWAEAFEHRFDGAELDGHPVGNIILAGLTDTLGSFGAAIDECLRLLGSVGRVVPATVEPVTLKAVFRDPLSPGGHNVVEGEVEVGQTLNLMSIAVVPPDPTPPTEAIDAIGRADQLILGPGSLFTSVLAVLAVPAINGAVAKAKGRKIYVANLGEQHPETTGFDVADHLVALRAHGVEVDVVLSDPGGLRSGDLSAFGAELVHRPLATPSGRLHDPLRLAEALAELAELI